MTLFASFALGLFITTIPLMVVVAYLELNDGHIENEREKEFVVWITSTVLFTALMYFKSNGMI